MGVPWIPVSPEYWDSALWRATVIWLRNAGGPPPTFQRPQPILANGRPIELGNHSSAPHAIDADADGALDLIVGAETGKVHYYHRSLLTGPLLTLVGRTDTGP